MANQTQLLQLQPFSTNDIGQNVAEVPFESPDALQLAIDVINVKEKRVDISTFPPEYQKKMKAFYQFSATRIFTNSPKIAKRTQDTLDIV
jgi:hypothetical protein